MKYICIAALNNECNAGYCLQHKPHDIYGLGCEKAYCDHIMKQVKCVETDKDQCSCYFCLERKLMGDP